MEIECFSSSKHDIELHKIVDRENYIFDHDQFSKKEFGNGIYVTKFTREKLPCDSTLRRYYCNYENKIGKSEYFVDIQCNENTPKWSQWSNWTECHTVRQRVTRSRFDLRNSKTLQEQFKYCKCSDLVQFQGPR